MSKSCAELLRQSALMPQLNSPKAQVRPKKAHLSLEAISTELYVECRLVEAVVGALGVDTKELRHAAVFL